MILARRSHRRLRRRQRRQSEDRLAFPPTIASRRSSPTRVRRYILATTSLRFDSRKTACPARRRQQMSGCCSTTKRLPARPQLEARRCAHSPICTCISECRSAWDPNACNMCICTVWSTYRTPACILKRVLVNRLVPSWPSSRSARPDGNSPSSASASRPALALSSARLLLDSLFWPKDFDPSHMGIFSIKVVCNNDDTEVIRWYRWSRFARRTILRPQCDRDPPIGLFELFKSNLWSVNGVFKYTHFLEIMHARSGLYTDSRGRVAIIPRMTR